MSEKIRYVGGTNWLKPYVDSVSDLVNLKKLTAIRAYKVSLDKIEGGYGSCGTDDFKTFTISLRLHGQVMQPVEPGWIPVGHTRLTLYQVLQTLAHELAHLKHWDHTPKHLKLEARITTRFARVMADSGIKDSDTKKHPKAHPKIPK